MTDLEITQDEPGRYRLSGELDMASAEVLQRALWSVAEEGRLDLDIGDLTFIDSSGLRALVKLSDRMNGAAPLVLSNVPTSIRRLLEIVGLEALPGIEVEAGG
jgi:anti-anti-sigma factor